VYIYVVTYKNGPVNNIYIVSTLIGRGFLRSNILYVIKTTVVTAFGRSSSDACLHLRRIRDPKKQEGEIQDLEPIIHEAEGLLTSGSYPNLDTRGTMWIKMSQLNIDFIKENLTWHRNPLPVFAHDKICPRS